MHGDAATKCKMQLYCQNLSFMRLPKILRRNSTAALSNSQSLRQHCIIALPG